jgi:uncharacterized protein YaiL (DUF2058 family)
MSDEKQKFKDAKKKYLTAIKESDKALRRAVKHEYEQEKYPSFKTKEAAAEKEYRAACNALWESLHRGLSEKKR